MRALSYGLPLVIVPGLGGDQPLNAAAAEAWGVGRALPGNADKEMIRGTIQQVLNTPGYRDRAARISQQVAGLDGAREASREIELLL